METFVLLVRIEFALIAVSLFVLAAFLVRFYLDNRGGGPPQPGA